MATYHANELFNNGCTFVEHHIDDLGLEHSIVPTTRPDIDRLTEDNRQFHADATIGSLQQQNQQLLQPSNLVVQKQAYKEYLKNVLSQLQYFKKALDSIEESKATSQFTWKSISVNELFGSVESPAWLPETPWDAVKVSQVEKSSSSTLPKEATSSAPRAKPINFIAMLAAMDNIQEEQPGANTPWIAYDLRMLEDEISVKGRQQM